MSDSEGQDDLGLECRGPTRDRLEDTGFEVLDERRAPCVYSIDRERGSRVESHLEVPRGVGVHLNRLVDARLGRTRGGITRSGLDRERFHRGDYRDCRGMPRTDHNWCWVGLRGGRCSRRQGAEAEDPQRNAHKSGEVGRAIGRMCPSNAPRGMGPHSINVIQVYLEGRETRSGECGGEPH